MEAWSIEKRSLKKLCAKGNKNKDDLYNYLAIANDGVVLDKEEEEEKRKPLWAAKVGNTVVQKARHSPSGLFLALGFHTRIEVYDTNTSLEVASLEDTCGATSFGFLDDETLWVEEPKRVISWTFLAFPLVVDCLFNLLGSPSMSRRLAMECSRKLCVFMFSDTGTLPRTLHIQYTARPCIRWEISSKAMSDLRMHTAAYRVCGSWLALSTGRGIDIFFFGKEFFWHRSYRVLFFPDQYASSFSNDLSMAIQFDQKKNLIDLVGSAALVGLFLALPFLPLYVVLLVADWTHVFVHECTIEMAEQWQHAKKVEVLLGVEKSIAAVKEKRRRK